MGRQLRRDGVRVMTFRPMKPETQARVIAEHKKRRRQNSEDLTARLVEKYLAEPDREYARDVWGSMLEERGVSLDDLDAS